MLPDAAAMARQVSAAEHAAQHAVAEANALRSALSEAEAANLDLHAQLRMWASPRDAAKYITRRVMLVLTQKYSQRPAAELCSEVRAVTAGSVTTIRQQPRSQL